MCVAGALCMQEEAVALSLIPSSVSFDIGSCYSPDFMILLLDTSQCGCYSCMSIGLIDCIISVFETGSYLHKPQTHCI